MLHVSRCALTRRTLWHQPHVSSSFLSKVIGKKRTATRWRHNVTSDDLSTGNDATTRQGYQHSLSGYDSEWVWHIWCGLEVLQFLPLTHNGRVMKMIWPEVTDIKKKNPRYTNRKYLCPYCTMQISKSLDLWCVFDRLSNFEKYNLRSCHKGTNPP